MKAETKGPVVSVRRGWALLGAGRAERCPLGGRPGGCRVRPTTAPFVTAPQYFPAAHVNECQPPTVQPKSFSRWGSGAALRCPRWWKSLAASPTTAAHVSGSSSKNRARRPSRLGGPLSMQGVSPAEFQSSLEIFRVLFSSNICVMKTGHPL